MSINRWFNRYSLAVGFCCTLSALQVPVSYANTQCASVTPADVSQVAYDNLDLWEGHIRFLDLITGGQKASTPKKERVFSSLSEAAKMMQSPSNKGSKLIFGKPFQIYTIHPDDVLGYTAGSDLSSVIKPVRNWLVPVFNKGRQMFLLDVSCTDSGLQVAGIGSKPLAKAMNTFNEFIKTTKNAGPSKLVRIYQLQTDLIVTERDRHSVVYPLTFQQDYVKLATDEFYGYTPSDIFSTLSHRLRAMKDNDI